MPTPGTHEELTMPSAAKMLQIKQEIGDQLTADGGAGVAKTTDSTVVHVD